VAWPDGQWVQPQTLNKWNAYVSQKNSKIPISLPIEVLFQTKNASNPFSARPRRWGAYDSPQAPLNANVSSGNSGLLNTRVCTNNKQKFKFSNSQKFKNTEFVFFQPENATKRPDLARGVYNAPKTPWLTERGHAAFPPIKFTLVPLASRLLPTEWKIVPAPLHWLVEQQYSIIQESPADARVPRDSNACVNAPMVEI